MFSQTAKAIKAINVAKSLWNSQEDIKKILAVFTRISAVLEEIMPKWKPYSGPIQELIKTFQEEYEKLGEEEGYILHPLIYPPNHADEKFLSGIKDKEIILYFDKGQLNYVMRKSEKECIHHIIEEGVEDNRLEKKYIDQFKNIIHSLSCDLIWVSSPIHLEILKDVSITSHVAYVRSGDQLFYVNKMSHVYEEIKLDKDKIKIFDDEMKPDEKPRILSEDELKKINLLTSHTHVPIPISVECKLALLDLTSRLGDTPYDPWRSFFSALKRIFGVMDGILGELSNGKEIEHIIQLLSHLLLQSLLLIRSFDNLDLDLTLGLIIPKSVNDMRKVTYDWMSELIKKIIPTQLQKNIDYIKLHILHPDEFKKLPRAEQASVLVLAGQVNRVFEELHLLLDKLEIHLNLKQGALSSIKLNNGAYQSLTELNETFRDSYYKPLMKLAGYPIDKKTFYPFLHSIVRGRKKILDTTLEMLRDEIIQVNDKHQKLVKETSELIKKEVIHFTIEYENEQNEIPLNTKSKKTKEKKLELTNHSIKALKDLQEKLPSNELDRIPSLTQYEYEDENSMGTDTDEYYSIADDEDRDVELRMGEETIKYEIEFSTTTLASIEEKLKLLPDNATIKLMRDYYKEHKQNMDRVQRKWTSLIKHKAKIEKIIADQIIVNGEDELDTEEKTDDSETIINELIQLANGSSKVFKSLLSVFLGEKSSLDSVKQNESISGSSLPIDRLAEFENKLTTCEKSLEKIFDEHANRNWHEKFTIANDAIAILKRLQPQFEPSSPGDKEVYLSPESDLYHTWRDTNSAIIALEELLRAIKDLENDPVIGELVSLLGLRSIFSRDQQSKKDLATYCTEFLVEQLGKETYDWFVSQLNEFKTICSNPAKFSSLSPLEQNILLMTGGLVNHLFQKVATSLAHLEKRLSIRENYLTSIPLVNGCSLQQLQSEFDTVYRNNLKASGYSLENRNTERDWPKLIQSSKTFAAKFSGQGNQDKAPYDFKEARDLIQMCDEFAKDYLDPEIYEHCFQNQAEAVAQEGSFVSQLANSFHQLKHSIQYLEILLSQCYPNNERTVKINAESPEAYAIQLEELISRAYDQVNELKTSLKNQWVLIKPFTSVEKIKKWVQENMSYSSSVIDNEIKIDPIYARASDELRRQALSLPDRWLTVSDTLKELSKLLGESSQNEMASKIVKQEVDQFFKLLSEWQVFSANRLNPPHLFQMVGFCWDRLQMIWFLVGNFAQAQSTIWETAGTALLKLAEATNLILRDLYLMMDKIEIEFGLKEGLLKNLKIYNDVSLQTILEKFHRLLSDYEFKLDESYPYLGSMITQRKMMLGKAKQSSYPDVMIDFIQNKIASLEAKRSRVVTERSEQSEKEDNRLNDTINRAIDTRFNCLKSKSKEKEILQTLQKSPHISLQHKLDDIAKDSNNRSNMHYLYEGKTWKGMKEFIYEGATKDDLLLLIDNRINQLKLQRTKKYYFFAAKRHAEHEDHIQALICFKSELGRAGYTLADAKKLNTIDRLYAVQPPYREILLREEQALLQAIRKIDDHISPLTRGKKKIDFLHSLQPSHFQPLNDIEKYHIKLINDRISELTIEIKKSWFAHTKEIKIQLLQELRLSLRMNKTLDQALGEIKNHKELGQHFYLLMEGRTSRVIQEIEHLPINSFEMIRLIDIEIARLKQQRGQPILFFAASHIATLETCIQALFELKKRMEDEGKSCVVALDEFQQQDKTLYAALCKKAPKLIYELKLREAMLEHAKEKALAVLPG